MTFFLLNISIDPPASWKKLILGILKKRGIKNGRESPVGQIVWWKVKGVWTGGWGSRLPHRRPHPRGGFLVASSRCVLQFPLSLSLSRSLLILRAWLSSCRMTQREHVDVANNFYIGTRCVCAQASCPMEKIFVKDSSALYTALFKITPDVVTLMRAHSIGTRNKHTMMKNFASPWFFFLYFFVFFFFLFQVYRTVFCYKIVGVNLLFRKWIYRCEGVRVNERNAIFFYLGHEISRKWYNRAWRGRVGERWRAKGLPRESIAAALERVFLERHQRKWEVQEDARAE